MEFMTSFPADEKVVVVGHSLGGLLISKAMETFPEKISVAVFLSAIMPGPNINTLNVIIPHLDNRITYDNGPTNPPTTVILGPKFLAANVYHLSSIKDLALATTLVRPFYLYPLEDVAKEIVLSREKYGSVRRVFIVVAENKGLKKDFQQLLIEKNPPDEVEEIEGSDHMTMMSNPQQLFTTLLGIANKYT
ncbi:methyl jasmonate esterase 1-like [Solanum stenotomum]|uniref:methyl jasmonate esterase 1-like n=1 Tax=Solanum stenotomum TaxID=172797 RepID=UPI0020D1CB83|nr:methyl jasmonate esterase 1-like [Solanum stenotomum]